MGFSRQEYWSGSPRLPLGEHPDPGIEPTSLMSPAPAGKFFTTRATWETYIYIYATMEYCSAIKNKILPLIDLGETSQKEKGR